MNNQQQTSKAEKVASKLINKLALTELELANREVDIDELNAKVQQLTKDHQQFYAANQHIISTQETKTED